MAVLNPNTTVKATFNGTDIPGYFLGLLVPAHDTVSGYIENALRGSGYFSGAVAVVSSGNITVTATTARQMDSNAALEAIRFALISSYVDTSHAQASFNVLGQGVGLPAPTNYGGFVNEYATQIGDNTNALVTTGVSAAFRSVAAALGVSADVRSIQAALNRLPSNQARLAEDGAFGAKTRARVIEFQQQNGLPATGVLDYLTIQRILAAAPGTTPAPNTNNNLPQGVNPYNAAPPPGDGSSSWIIYGVLALVIVYALD